MTSLTRRSFASTALGAGLAALAGGLSPRAIALTDPDVERLLASVDPELRPIARDMISGKQAMPAMTEANLPLLRKSTEAWIRPPLAGVPIDYRHVPGAKGDPEVAIAVINAKPGTARPAILHTHGGGFILGTPRTDISTLQAIAQALDCAIISVDYRLAPETRYRGSIEDNYAGLKWLYANADALGVDRRRIAVMGESAGGGHAALLAITARDRGEIPVMFQCLIWPMLDDRTGSTRPVMAPAGQLVWTAAGNRFGWRSFLGVEPGSANVPATAVPARVASVAGLPPAYIAVGSLDLFVDEDIAYAQRLLDAGIPAELHVIPGGFHGFDVIAQNTAIAEKFRNMKIDALRRAFAAPAGTSA